MCYKSIGLTIFGMSIQTETCQIRGQVSRSLLYWKKNPPKEICSPGRRLTKVQTISRPDHVWPEVWTKIGNAAQNREQQEWAKEMRKLDSARKLKGIYFMDPDDQDCKETTQMRWEEWRDLWHQPCLAKGKLKLASRKWLQSRKLHQIPKTICGCVVEFHESTGQRVESSVPAKTWRSHCGQKDLLRWRIAIWCSSLFRCHQRGRFRMQKQQWTRNGRSSKRFQPGSWTK